MAITYKGTLALFKKHKITTYSIKKHKILGQATYAKILNGENVNLSSIDSLCKYFNCQPGDLIEYVPDNESGTGSALERNK